MTTIEHIRSDATLESENGHLESWIPKTLTGAFVFVGVRLAICVHQPAAWLGYICQDSATGNRPHAQVFSFKAANLDSASLAL